jgi:hypothetical protein
MKEYNNLSDYTTLNVKNKLSLGFVLNKVLIEYELLSNYDKLAVASLHRVVPPLVPKNCSFFIIPAARSGVRRGIERTILHGLNISSESVLLISSI